MRCAFFGHRNVPAEAEELLRIELKNLIENHGADLFYVGTQGEFDRMATRVVKNLMLDYPHIKYARVPAYLPHKNDTAGFEDCIYPEGLEYTPKKFAILKRNRRMIDHCDTAVVYVCHTHGGAAEAVRLAEKKKRPIINIAKSKTSAE